VVGCGVAMTLMSSFSFSANSASCWPRGLWFMISSAFATITSSGGSGWPGFRMSSSLGELGVIVFLSLIT
jgi:hypothetical protein